MAAFCTRGRSYSDHHINIGTLAVVMIIVILCSACLQSSSIYVVYTCTFLTALVHMHTISLVIPACNAADLTSFGFRVAPGGFYWGSGQAHTFTIWHDAKVYRCIITPRSYGAYYACNSTQLRHLGDYCGNDKAFRSKKAAKVLIENPSGDVSFLQDFFISTSNNRFYGIDGNCQPPNITNTYSRTLPADRWTKTAENLCSDNFTNYDKICLSLDLVDGCLPIRQVLHFNLDEPDTYITNALWEDGSDVVVRDDLCVSSKGSIKMYLQLNDPNDTIRLNSAINSIEGNAKGLLDILMLNATSTTFMSTTINIVVEMYFINLEQPQTTQFGEDMTREIYNDYGDTIIVTEIVVVYVAVDDGDSDVRITLFDIFGYIFMLLLLVCSILVIFFARKFWKNRPGTDRPAYFALFKFVGSLADFYTDFFWALTLYASTEKLGNIWIAAFLFVFGPHTVSIIIGCFHVVKWRQNRQQLHESEYASRYDKLIILLTVLAGFYATADIISSHLFHLPLLSFQLDSKERAKISNLKIINAALFENFPCFIIQCWVIAQYDEFVLDINAIAMVFSIVGILSGVMTLLSRGLNKGISMVRAPWAGVNKITMQFSLKNVKQNASTNDGIKPYHVHTHFLMAKSIEVALNMHPVQVRITEIRAIVDGIQVTAYLRYLRDEEATRILTELSGVGGNDNRNTQEQTEMFCNLHKECCHRLCVRSDVVYLNVSSIAPIKRTENERDLPRQLASLTVETVQRDTST